MAWLPEGWKKLKLYLFDLTQSTNVTDRQTDTAWWHRLRLCIASCGKHSWPRSRKHEFRRQMECSISSPCQGRRPRALYMRGLAAVFDRSWRMWTWWCMPVGILCVLRRRSEWYIRLVVVLLSGSDSYRGCWLACLSVDLLHWRVCV